MQADSLASICRTADCQALSCYLSSRELCTRDDLSQWLHSRQSQIRWYQYSLEEQCQTDLYLRYTKHSQALRARSCQHVRMFVWDTETPTCRRTAILTFWKDQSHQNTPFGKPNRFGWLHSSLLHDGIGHRGSVENLIVQAPLCLRRIKLTSRWERPNWSWSWSFLSQYKDS